MDRAGNQRVQGIRIHIPVAAGEKIEQTQLVAINADGYAVCGKKAAGLQTAGIAHSMADNRLGTDGAEVVTVYNGGYTLKQDGSIHETDLLKTCYMADASTVTLTAEGASAAGTIVEVDGDYVTVMITV